MRFYTMGLLSKWGFMDGDILDDLLFDNELGESDPHKVLISIVKDIIIPAIKQDVEVYEVSCIHNPIRADKVDGEKVDCFKDNDIMLNPEYVDVEDSVILDIARKLL